MRRGRNDFGSEKRGYEKGNPSLSPYILPQYRESVREREGEAREAVQGDA
jgi:hypothetical protein